jgi:hypothetical protein
VRILHRDTGRTRRGGQIQLRLLADGLRQAGVLCGIQSPLWEEPMTDWDLIHCHDARSHTWARKPFVVSRRVGFPVGRGWLSRWKYSRAAAYLAVSRFAADQLMAAGVPYGKIHLVPDAIPAIPPADRSTGRVLLLSKNGAQVAGTVPVRNLEEDLRECAVFVYLSDMEGLGSAALLAQAAGVPVVASRAGGLVEAVHFGLVADQLADVPVAIDEARRMSADGAWVARQYSVGRMVEQTMEVYRKVLGA